jgi:hypothetical protein
MALLRPHWPALRMPVTPRCTNRLSLLLSATWHARGVNGSTDETLLVLSRTRELQLPSVDPESCRHSDCHWLKFTVQE